MTTMNFHLLAISCILFASRSSTIDLCPKNPIPAHPCRNEYTYGPCRLTVQQKPDQKNNGLSVSLDLTANSSSECKQQKPKDPDYVQLPGHGYYKYYSVKMTWYQAWNVCKSDGGHLAVFNSAEEAKFVGSIPKTEYDWAFIGFGDYFIEGIYATIFDQTLKEAGYEKWEQSNPNGKTGENCGVTFRSGELGDYVCSDPRTFFCEISCQHP